MRLGDTHLLNNNTAQHAKALLDGVYQSYTKVPLRFESPRYWHAMRFCFERTVADVLDIVRDVRCNHVDGVNEISVLEIGAFTGVVSTALARAGLDVTAADLPMFMLDEALRKHFQAEGVRTLDADLAALPLRCEDNQFHVLVCCEVIEHLNFNVIPVLREFARVLKPGGTIYVATPNHANIVKRLLLLRGKSIHNSIEHLVRQLDPQSAFSIGLHWREYTMEELKQLLELVGLSVERQYYFHYKDRQGSPVSTRP